MLRFATVRAGMVGALVVAGLLVTGVSAQKGKPPAPSPCDLDGYCELNEGTTCADCALPASGRTLTLQNNGTEFFHTGASTLTLFRWEGSGFKAVWASNALSSLQGRATALGRLTGNESPELVTTQYWSKGSTRYERILAFRAGSTGAPFYVGPADSGSTATTYASVLHDFDGDGKAEFVRARNVGGVVHVVMHRWNETGLTEVWRSGRFSQMFFDLAVGDVDYDGQVELLASTTQPGRVLVFEVTTNSDGQIAGFGEPVSTVSSGSATVNQIAVATLDTDPLPALAGASFDNAMVVWRRNSAGEYPVIGATDFGSASAHVAAGNLDDDPFDELILATNEKRLYVYKWLNSQLALRASLALPGVPYLTSIGDVDGDGVNEIVDGYTGVFKYANGQLSQVNVSFGAASYGVATVVR